MKNLVKLVAAALVAMVLGFLVFIAVARIFPTSRWAEAAQELERQSEQNLKQLGNTGL